MRMIDAKQAFAPFAHLSLGGEEIFRRRFVGNGPVSGDVAEG